MKTKKKKILARVLTIVGKLDELQQALTEVYPRIDPPSVENLKQELYDWYSANLE